MDTPRTAAGRTLLDDLGGWTRHDPSEWNRRILAIEAEAEAAQPSGALREALERLVAFWDNKGLLGTDDTAPGYDGSSLMSVADQDEWERLTDEARAALAAAPAEGLGVERLGLSDEQTAILRKHLTSRQQTVSEFLGDMLMDIGLGRATGKEYPSPARLREGTAPTNDLSTNVKLVDATPEGEQK